MINQAVILELIQMYLLITFILLSVKLSQLKIIDIIIESKRSGVRARNVVNSFKDKTKESLKLVLIWPIFIYTYLRDVAKKRKLRNPKA